MVAGRPEPLSDEASSADFASKTYASLDIRFNRRISLIIATRGGQRDGSRKIRGR